MIFEKNIVKVIDIIESKTVLVFDFDGVLADSVEIKTRAFGDLYKEYGVSVVDKITAFHTQNGGLSRVEKFKYFHTVFLGQSISQETLNTLNENFSNLVKTAVINSVEIPGATEFLKHYCNDSRIAFINSATPSQEIKEIVSKRGMDSLFNGVYGSSKSKVDNMKYILSKFNVSPKDMVFFGDSSLDLEAAQIIGCDFVGIGTYFGNLSTQNPKFSVTGNYGFLEDFEDTLPLTSRLTKP